MIRLPRRLVFGIWAGLGWLALPWGVLYLFFRHALWGGRRRFRHRLGFVSRVELPGDPDQGLIWIHAVSVGEVRAAQPLVDRLQSEWPQLGIWLSSGTLGGMRVAERLGIGDCRGWLPLDAPPCCRLALGRLRPRLLLLVETEIWPNLLRTAQALGIPVLLINARLDDEAYPRYRLTSWLFAPVLGCYHRILAQNPLQAERFLALGAVETQVRACGDLKVEAAKALSRTLGAREAWRRRLGIGESELLLVGGSTQSGEEAILAEIYRRLGRRGLPLRLLLAPRHPERVHRIGQALSALRLPSVRHSALPLTAQPEAVILLDSLGELDQLYAAADLVVIGKSLRPGGGQNPMEPTVWGRAMVFGPSMENFLPIVERLLAAGAAIQVGDAVALEAVCADLLEDHERRAEMGRRAQAVMAALDGGLESYLGEIRSLLGTGRT